MIRIPDYKKEKATFKKLFKGSSLFLTLKLQNDKVQIIIQNADFEKIIKYTINAETDSPFSSEKTIYLSFINPLDCVFDIIFSESGFFVETWKNAYPSLTTVINKETGTEGYISQVIFKNKTKIRDFVVPCNRYSDIIQ